MICESKKKSYLKSQNLKIFGQGKLNGIVEIADAKTSSETIFINDWWNFLLKFWFFLSHFSVTKILEGFFPDFSNSSMRCVPSMQNKSWSFGDDPLLNDLNLLTRLLFLLVIFKKVFSMSNLKNLLSTIF